MICEIEGRCQFEGCILPATHIARGRNSGHAEPACYCERHAIKVTEEGSPEYIETCPNCDCMFGVN